MESNQEIQGNEILALQSIYESEFSLNEFDKININKPTYSGTISIKVEPIKVPIRLEFEVDTIFVHHLPPIFLSFELPLAYPTCLPKFSLHCFWLNSSVLEATENKLIRIWNEEQAEILFIWVDFIQNTLLDFLSMSNSIKVISVNQDHQVSPFVLNSFPKGLLQLSNQGNILNSDPIFLMKNWDIYISRKEFDLSPHACGICFDTKKGTMTISLTKCQHVYCRQCLSGFFLMLIREGLVFAVQCPHDVCRLSRKGLKAYSEEARPDLKDILDLVGDESFERYNRLHQKQRVEMDPMVTWCPLPSCGKPVTKTSEDEKLCVCENCGYAFCQFCKRTWHGSQTFCEMPKGDRIGEQYLKAREAGDSMQMAGMELRFGKKKLAKLVDDMWAQKQFEEWRNNNAQNCPKCLASIEKAFGCNHMSCPVCDCHFCYICGDKINKHNPYSHFNDLGSTCHMRLFEGVEVDDDEFIFDPFELM